MAQQQGQDGGNAQDQQKVVGPNITGTNEEYRLERKLQSGLFGGVYEAKGLSTRRSFAVKVIHLSEMTKAQQANHLEFCEVPLNEITYLKEMSDDEHLMEVKDHFQDTYCHYIVFELAPGGDLLEALKMRPHGFDEHQAQFLIGQAAKGLSVLHQRRLAMQDVSLENMLITYLEDGRYQIKICDPGQATVFDLDRNGEELPVEFKGFVGKSFRPPELQQQLPYLASKVDAWCLGWSTFYLLAAQPLFLVANHTDKDWSMFAGNEITKLFEQKGASKCTNRCVEFILKLMDLEPRRRHSIAQALQHEWLNDPSVRPMYQSRSPYTQAVGAPLTSPAKSNKTVYNSGSNVAQGGGGSSVAVGQSGSVQAAASRTALSPDATRAARFRHPNLQNGSALNGSHVNGKHPASPATVASNASNRAASRGQAPAWKMAPTSRSESPSPGPSSGTSAVQFRQPQQQSQTQQQAPRNASPFAAPGPRDENIARQLGTPRRPDTAARSVGLGLRSMGGSALQSSSHPDPLLSLGSRTAQYALPTPTNTANGSDGGGGNSPTGYGGSSATLLSGAASGTTLGDGLPSGNGPAAVASRATSGQSGRQQQLGSGLGDTGHGSSAGAVQAASLQAAVGAGGVRTSSPIPQQAFILKAATGTTSRGYSPGPGQHMSTTLGQRAGSPLQSHGTAGVPMAISATRSSMSGSALVDNSSGGHYWQSPRAASPPGSTVIRANEVFARGRSTTRASSPSQVAAHSPAPIMNTYSSSNPGSPVMRAVSPVVTGVPSRAGASGGITWHPAPLSPPPNKRSVSPVPVPVGAVSGVPKWVA